METFALMGFAWLVGVASGLLIAVRIIKERDNESVTERNYDL